MGLTNVLERAIHMLSSPNKPERLEAVRELIRVCESQDLVDFERVHAALRSRTSFFPRVEQDREVFAYLISATKRVARLRTRAVGFRVARPSTIEDHTVDLSAVLTWIWDSSNIYGTREEFDSSVDGASAGLLGVFALQFSTSEIRNGGFHQYFSNPTGILYPDAVEALRSFRTRKPPKSLNCWITFSRWRRTDRPRCESSRPRPSTARKSRSVFPSLLRFR